MLTINHQSLPNTNSPFKACAPALIMPGNLQPTVVIDPYADTRSNNFSAVSYPTPDPYEVNYYYKISVVDALSINIDNYTNLEFPSLLAKNSFWLDDGLIHLCSIKLDQISINITYQIQIPIDLTGKLSINVPLNLDIQIVSCPDKGIFNITFTREDNECILSSELYSNLLEFGDFLEIKGNQEEILGTSLAQIAFFDLRSPVLIPEIEGIGEYWETENNELILSEPNIKIVTEDWKESSPESTVYSPELIDVFDYLGKSYRQVVNDYAPEIGEFFLESGKVKVFMSSDALIPKSNLSIQGDSNSFYTKLIGSISF